MCCFLSIQNSPLSLWIYSGGIFYSGSYLFWWMQAPHTMWTSSNPDTYIGFSRWSICIKTLQLWVRCVSVVKHVWCRVCHVLFNNALTRCRHTELPTSIWSTVPGLSSSPAHDNGCLCAQWQWCCEDIGQILATAVFIWRIRLIYWERTACGSRHLGVIMVGGWLWYPQPAPLEITKVKGCYKLLVIHPGCWFPILFIVGLKEGRSRV